MSNIDGPLPSRTDKVDSEKRFEADHNEQNISLVKGGTKERRSGIFDKHKSGPATRAASILNTTATKLFLPERTAEI